MPKEVTALAPEEEARFQRWARANQIGDVDHPDSYYDYRGYYQETKGAPHKKGEHFPDTYKQHGHPTFSVESKYSRGLQDGGRWLPGDTEKAYVKPPLPSHEVDAEGKLPYKELGVSVATAKRKEPVRRR